MNLQAAKKMVMAIEGRNQSKINGPNVFIWVTSDETKKSAKDAWEEANGLLKTTDVVCYITGH